MRTVGSRTRQVQIVQPLNHLVPVAPLPVDPLARRTAPELLVARADSGGDESFDLFPRYRHEHSIAEGTAGERVDEPKRQDRRDLANLLFEVIAPDPHAARHSGRQLLVPRQEDPTFAPRPVGEFPVRGGIGIRGVVSHEPQPARETPQHVVTEQSHRRASYSRRTPSPSRSTAVSLRGTMSSTRTAPRPPARVGAVLPPTTAPCTNTFSSSTNPASRNDHTMVLPPSTRSVDTPRPFRISRSFLRSTSSFPHRTTSAGGKTESQSSAVATIVGADPSRTAALVGVRPSESTTTRSGFRSSAYSGFTMSRGSSVRTVPMPTRIASTFARSRWTRCMSSSLLNRTGRKWMRSS